jgi:Tfp pilus assembly protein PilF
MDLLGGMRDKEEQDPVFSWYLAGAEREEEQFESAAKHYKEAAPYLAAEPEFLEEYGDFLWEEGRRGEAAALYNKAMIVDPSLVHLQEKISLFEDEI